jgi:hypothetical protein
MELAIVIIAVLGYLAYSSGALAQFGVAPPPSLSQNGPPVQIVPASASVANAQTSNAATVNAVGTGLNFIPVVGPAVSAAYKAITSVLLAASAARAKAATSENAAVAAGIPGFDTAVGQIAQGFNAGTITYTQAQTLFGLALSNFWAEVTGKIQSGRNGCNTGANCPPSSNVASSSATSTTASSNYCSGSIGAACCVGCADLALSVSNLQWAVAQCAKTGLPQTAFIQTVYASKYGGANRPSYLVSFTPTAVS